MAHRPAELQKVIESAAPPDPELLFRPIFGGIGVYAGGRMFCSLSDVGLALKLTGADHEELLKTRGAKALQYEPSMPPSKTYVVVPGAMLKDASCCAHGSCVPPPPRVLRRPGNRARGRTRPRGARRVS